MAIIKGSGDPFKERARKKRKPKYGHVAPGAKVAPATAQKLAQDVFHVPDVSEDKLKKPKSLIEANLKPMTEAYKTEFKKTPTASQAFGLLSAVNEVHDVAGWRKFINPDGNPYRYADPVQTAMQRFSLAYFSQNATMPSAEKMRAFLEARPALAGNMDYNTLYQTFTIGGIPGAYDITLDKPLKIAANKASENRTRRNRHRWTMADIAALPTAEKTAAMADKERELANRPMHSTGKKWDEMTEDDKRKIREARYWYDPKYGGKGTSLKKRINMDWGQYSVLDENGDPDLAATRNLFASDPSLDPKKNPYSIIAVQDRLFDKKREELNHTDVSQLFTIGLAIQSAYGQEFTNWLNKVGGWEKATWDGEFDTMARGYMIMTALPDAYYIPRTETDPERLARQQRAVKIIELATGGEFASTDDLQVYIDQLNSVGNKGDGTPASEQYANLMFSFFYKTNTTLTPEQAVIKFAKLYGEDNLPQQQQRYLQVLHDQWNVWEKAANEIVPGQTLGAVWGQMLSNSETYRKLVDSKSWLVREDPDARANKNTILLEGSQDDIKQHKSAREIHAAVTGEDYLALEQRYNDAILYDKTKQYYPQQTGVAGVRGPIPGAAKMSTDQYQGFFNIMGPVGKAVQGGFAGIERLAAQVYLTLHLAQNYERDELPEWSRNAQDFAQGLTDLLTGAPSAVANVATGDKPLGRAVLESGPTYIPIPSDRAWGHWGELWREAGAQTEEEGQKGFQAFTDSVMESNGLDPWGDDKLLAGVLYWRWSLGKDMAFDAAWGGIKAGGKLAALQVLKRMRTPAIVAQEAWAQGVLRSARLAATKEAAAASELAMPSAVRAATGRMRAGDRARAVASEMLEREMKNDPLFVPETFKADPEVAKALDILHEIYGPASWEPTAVGLSKRVFADADIFRMLNIQDHFLLERGNFNAVRKLVHTIATTVDDPDAIRGAFAQLKRYGFEIDPGASFRNQKRYDDVLKGISDPRARIGISPAATLEMGTHDPMRHFEAFLTLTNGGFARTNAGRKQGYEYLRSVMDELFAIEGKTPQERFNQIQDLYKRVQDETFERLRDSHAHEHDVNRALKWATRAGGGAREQVELALEQAKKRSVNRAKRLAKEAADRLSKSTGEKVLPKAVDEEGYVSDWDLFKIIHALQQKDKKQISHMAGDAVYDEFDNVPMFEEQLSKNLPNSTPMQDLVSYLTGHWEWDVATRVRTFYAFPSMMATTNAFRILAIGHLLFGVSATFMDEAWRFFPEALEGRINMSPRALARAKAMTNASGTRKVVTGGNALIDMTKDRNTYYRLVDPEHPDYWLWLNQAIQDGGSAESTKAFHDILRDLMAEWKEAKRLADEGAEGVAYDETVFRTRLQDELDALITGRPSSLPSQQDEEAREALGEVVRSVMDRMNRDIDGEYHPYKEVEQEVSDLTAHKETIEGQIKEIDDQIAQTNEQIRVLEEPWEGKESLVFQVTHEGHVSDPYDYVLSQYPENHPVRQVYDFYTSLKRSDFASEHEYLQALNIAGMDVRREIVVTLRGRQQRLLEMQAALEKRVGELQQYFGEQVYQFPYEFARRWVFDNLPIFSGGYKKPQRLARLAKESGMTPDEYLGRLFETHQYDILATFRAEGSKLTKQGEAWTMQGTHVRFSTTTRGKEWEWTAIAEDGTTATARYDRAGDSAETIKQKLQDMIDNGSVDHLIDLQRGHADQSAIDDVLDAAPEPAPKPETPPEAPPSTPTPQAPVATGRPTITFGKFEGKSATPAMPGEIFIDKSPRSEYRNTLAAPGFQRHHSGGPQKGYPSFDSRKPITPQLRVAYAKWLDKELAKGPGNPVYDDFVELAGRVKSGEVTAIRINGPESEDTWMHSLVKRIEKYNATESPVRPPEAATAASARPPTDLKAWHKENGPRVSYDLTENYQVVVETVRMQGRTSYYMWLHKKGTPWTEPMPRIKGEGDAILANGDKATIEAAINDEATMQKAQRWADELEGKSTRVDTNDVEFSPVEEMDWDNPEHRAFAEQWMEENVDGISRNKKTGEWNTKAYQREEAGYDTHMAFHNAGEEYEDDMDVLETIFTDNESDMVDEWNRIAEEKFAEAAPTPEQAAPTPKPKDEVPSLGKGKQDVIPGEQAYPRTQQTLEDYMAGYKADPSTDTRGKSEEWMDGWVDRKNNRPGVLYKAHTNQTTVFEWGDDVVWTHAIADADGVRWELLSGPELVEDGIPLRGMGLYDTEEDAINALKRRVAKESEPSGEELVPETARSVPMPKGLPPRYRVLSPGTELQVIENDATGYVTFATVYGWPAKNGRKFEVEVVSPEGKHSTIDAAQYMRYVEAGDEQYKKNGSWAIRIKPTEATHPTTKPPSAGPSGPPSRGTRETRVIDGKPYYKMTDAEYNERVQRNKERLSEHEEIFESNRRANEVARAKQRKAGISVNEPIKPHPQLQALRAERDLLQSDMGRWVRGNPPSGGASGPLPRGGRQALPNWNQHRDTELSGELPMDSRFRTAPVAGGSSRGPKGRFQRTTEAMELDARQRQLARVRALIAMNDQRIAGLEDTALPKVTDREWTEFVRIEMPTIGGIQQPSKTFYVEWLYENFPELRVFLDGKTPANAAAPRRAMARAKGTDLYQFSERAKEMDIKDIRRIWRKNLSHEDQMAFRDAWDAYIADLRGIPDQLEQRNALRAEKVRLRAEKKILVQQRDAASQAAYNAARKAPKLSSRGEQWVAEMTDRMMVYALDDELFEAFMNKTPLTKKQIQKIRERISGQLSKLSDNKTPIMYGGGQGVGREARDLPMIMGVDPGATGEQQGSIPLLTPFVEKGISGLPGGKKLAQKAGEMTGVKGKVAHAALTLSPFSILDAISTKARDLMFRARFDVEYNKLLASGMKGGIGSEAHKLAETRAMRFIEDAQYSSLQTNIEHSLKPIFMFLPAYKQAALYWMRQFNKHPFMYYDIRRAINSDYAQIHVGPTTMPFPFRPFWAGATPAEMMMPGVTAPILIPLRAANAATAWKKNEETGGYDYIGVGKLDQLSAFPPLAFMDKSTSPLNWIDDLLYGYFGDTLQPTHANDVFWGGLYSVVLSMQKDPYSRRRMSMSLLQSQLAMGLKPDLKAADRALAANPAWVNFFRNLGFFKRPEVALQFLGRQVGLGRINYQPSDIGDINYEDGDDPTLWNLIFGDDEAQTIADAQYEYMQAMGDPVEQDAIEMKYPKLKAINDFMDMSNYEKAQYLSVVENRWVMPYVVGKNNYSTTGRMLTSQEYYTALTEGAILKRTTNEYLDGFSKLDINVKADDVLRKLAADKERLTRQAKTLIEKVAYEVFPTKEEAKDAIQKYYDQVEFEWYNRTVPNRTEGSSVSELPNWLGTYLDFHPGKKRENYSLYLINQSFVAATQWLVNRIDEDAITEDERINLKKAKLATVKLSTGEEYGPSSRGVEGYYDRPILYDKTGKAYTQGLGTLVEISDVFQKLLPESTHALLTIEGSASRHGINQILKENKPKQEYAALRMATDPTYYRDQGNPAKEYMSAGIRIDDPKKFNRMFFEMQLRWNAWDRKKKTPKSKGGFTDQYGELDSYSDEYSKAKSNYEKDVRAIIVKYGFESVLLNGTAGRLSQTYLVKQGGAKPKPEYVKNVVKLMRVDSPDVEKIVSMGMEPKSEKKEAALAWQAVLATIIDYRMNILPNTVSDYTHDKGVSPSTKQGKRKIWQIQRLADAWMKRNKTFKRQWELGKLDKLLHGSISFTPSMVDKDAY